MSLQLGPPTRIVTRPLADDGSAAEVDEPAEKASPTMAPPSVARAGGAHPHLSLVQRDEMAALVERVDRMMLEGEHGIMQEYPDLLKKHPTLFRYTVPDGRQSAHSIPVELLTARVRAKLWELWELLDEEAAAQR